MPTDPKIRAFLIHLAAYVVANAIMIGINVFLQAPPQGQAAKYWFQWPLIGWGIGVAGHGLGLLLERKRRQWSWVGTEAKRGFAVHAFVYVAVNILLFVVDWVTSPGLQWFYWPLLGWGIGLIAHGVIVWRTGGRARPTKREPASRSGARS